MNLPLLNQQPPEKQDLRDDGSLEVVSVFSTIQGEGPYAGRPAIFVRLAGCDLQCGLCDTDYTTGRQRLGMEELLRRIQDCNPRFPQKGLVVITGGEPFRQNLTPLVRTLLEGGETVQIETNGTLWVPDFPSWATIVCSPKTGSVHPEIRGRVRAWKYILSAGKVDPDDGLPTDSLNFGVRPARPPRGFSPTYIYLQPCDEKDEERNQVNRKAAVASCLKYGYTLCLQLHKELDLP